MTLRLLVLLGVLGLLGWRFLPRYRITWALPLVLGTTVVVVRGLAYVFADGS